MYLKMPVETPEIFIRAPDTSQEFHKIFVIKMIRGILDCELWEAIELLEKNFWPDTADQTFSFLAAASIVMTFAQNKDVIQQELNK